MPYSCLKNHVLVVLPNTVFKMFELYRFKKLGIGLILSGGAMGFTVQFRIFFSIHYINMAQCFGKPDRAVVFYRQLAIISTVGGYDNHPVRPPGTVNSSGRSIFQHLN